MTPEQITIVRQIIREELIGLIRSDRYTFQKTIQIADGVDIQLGTNTGTLIGLDSGNKIGFFGKTPIGQQANISNPVGGGTQDTQARAAIDSLLSLVENFGWTS